MFTHMKAKTRMSVNGGVPMKLITFFSHIGHVSKFVFISSIMEFRFLVLMQASPDTHAHTHAHCQRGNHMGDHTGVYTLHAVHATADLLRDMDGKAPTHMPQQHSRALQPAV